MSVAAPQPSSRFVRAAATERAELVRHRERLGSKRQALLDELSQLEAAMRNLDQRVMIIGQLLETESESCGASSDAEPLTPVGAPEPAAGPAPARILRGPAIREAAVRVLLDEPEYIEAIHYRRWYELMRRAGYAISGKKPLAVFLTQITRSPLVRKAGAPGVYEMDRQAPLRIRQRLERLSAELGELSASSPADSEMASARARRHDLDVAISQHERALEEALRVLRREGSSESPQRSSPDQAAERAEANVSRD